MPRIAIDGRAIEVPAGTTVLAAARELGIDIPTLCFLEGHAAQTSCMACLVKVNGGRRLLPACATVVSEGMSVESETDEVIHARRAAIELLLGDHLGDCIAPCQAACPARLNIPKIIRQIAAGKAQDAAPAARACRECGARCEKVCRRAAKDHAVSIQLLVRHAAEAGGSPPESRLVPPEKEFSVHIGRVGPDEISRFMAGASAADRVESSGGFEAGFTAEEAIREAQRCLHCDCRRPNDCRLRTYAALVGASPSRYRGERRTFEQQFHAQNIIYESGKCIACGLCVEITRKAAEPLGLTFVGRGFDVRVAVPFDRPLDEALQKAATECVRACPTGALAFDTET